MTFARLREQYPCLQDISDSQLQAAWQDGPISVSAGTVLFSGNTPCQGFPFVLSGVIQVRKASADGRGLSLYLVGAGEVCVASTSSLFANQLLQAEGVAISDTTLFVLRTDHFKAWLSSTQFRDFILGQLSARHLDLLALVEAVTFQRLDQRLAGVLLGHGAIIKCTHQSLADELGTVREIVSRLLKRFASQGLIEMSREQIQILDAIRLRQISQGMFS